MTHKKGYSIGREVLRKLQRNAATKQSKCVMPLPKTTDFEVENTKTVELIVSQIPERSKNNVNNKIEHKEIAKSIVNQDAAVVKEVPIMKDKPSPYILNDPTAASDRFRMQNNGETGSITTHLSSSDTTQQGKSENDRVDILIKIRKLDEEITERQKHRSILIKELGNVLVNYLSLKYTHLH